MVSCHNFPGLQSYRKTERSYPYIATVNAPVDLLVSMNDYDIAHDLQRFWPLDPTKICFFFVKNFMSSCFLFQPPGKCDGWMWWRWGESTLIGFDWHLGKDPASKKTSRELGVLPFFFCQDMHADASLCISVRTSTTISKDALFSHFS